MTPEQEDDYTIEACLGAIDRAKQMVALKASIRKWKHICFNNGKDLGADNCALCKLYLMDECSECPIYQDTNDIYCHGTPYDKWDYYQVKTGRYTVHDDESKRLALDMFNYLLDLQKRLES